MSRLEIKDLCAAGLGPVSLTLAEGECICLSGPSGSGKTRLLRAIADLDVHEAEVALDGTPRERLAPPEWRRRVGLLPADNQWWLERVGDHFPRPDADALSALALDPELLAQPVSRLSSGERQRFALLRLLANRPQVLLLDEPTANLDATNVSRVERLLERYRVQYHAGLLWVSHDAEQIQRLRARHLHMNQGRLHEDAGSGA